MNTEKAAKSYFSEARLIFQEARGSQEAGHYHRTVRKCQESVELALKGWLRLIGVEYPRSHRISGVLTRLQLDEVEPADLTRAAEICDHLADDREPSFYGTEEGTPEEMYDSDDGEQALTDCEFVIHFVHDFFQKFEEKKTKGERAE